MNVNMAHLMEAIQASVEYEVERGREPRPRINLGLLEFISKSRGYKCLAGIKLAEHIVGDRIISSIAIRDAHKRGVLVDIIERPDGRYEWVTTEEEL